MNTNRLKEIREDRDISQLEIAKYLNVTQPQYSRNELGVNIIPLEKINMLADFYNTSIDYLLYRPDKREPYPKSIINNKNKIKINV